MHQRSHAEIAPDVNDTTAVSPAASRTSNRSREIPAYIVWFISHTFPLQYEATSGLTCLTGERFFLQTNERDADAGPRW